jgi:hypothetical protein
MGNIVVAYSGGLRTFKYCYAHNDIVLRSQGYDPIYYITTWDFPCYTKVSRFEDIHANDGDTIYNELLQKDEKVTNEYLNGFLKFEGSLIFPKFHMDKMLDRFHIPWKVMYPGRLACQYFLMQMSSVIIKSEHRELPILRLRPDITIQNLPNVQSLDLDKVYINDMMCIGEKTNLSKSINEMVYLSSFNNFHKITKINTFLEDYLSENSYGEQVSRDHFAAMGLIKDCILYPYGIIVVRENGNHECIK